MRLSTRLQKTLAVGLLAVVCVLGTASLAFGAEKVTKADQINFAYIGTAASGQVMLNIQIPESVKLPAEVTFNFPMQTKIAWAGEILGGETSKDPEVMVTKVKDGEKVNTYTATLTKAHVLQVEGEDSAPSKNLENGNVLGTIGYTPAVDVDSLVLSMEVPKTATVVKEGDMEAFGTGTAGTVYGFTIRNAKANQDQAVEVEYKSNAAPKQSGASGSTNTVIIVLVVLLVLAIMALIIIAASKRMNHNDQESTSGSFQKGKKGASANKAQNAQKNKAMRVETAEEANEDEDEDEDYEEDVIDNKPSKNTSASSKSVEKSGKMSTKQLMTIITIAVVVVGAAAIIIAGSFANRVSEVNGVYYKEFAQGDPCQQVHFVLTDEALSNPENAASDIFKVLGDASVEILKASLDPSQKTLTVEFCESKTNGPAIEKILEGNKYVGASDAVATGEPIVQENGSVSMYVTETQPCVYNTFELKNPEGDVADVTKSIFEATKAIPSMARMNYNPDTKIITFGFCEEQTNDADIEKALKAAKFDVKLSQKAEKPAGTTE